MYTAFIVDDESLVITSLKSCADWEGLGFTIIGEANDGITAHEMILELKPDLVFADIRMPGMSGLELIKRVGDRNQNTLFIIISGYAEFAYVQKALSYGVLGYCLKPFDENEIAQLLLKAGDTIARARAALEIEYLSLLGDTGESAHSRIMGIFRAMGLKLDLENGIVAALSVGGQLSIPPHIRHIRLKPGGGRTVYFFQASYAEEFTGHIAGALPPGVLGVGLSTACHDEHLLPDAIEEAGIAANQYFMTGVHGVQSFSRYDQEKLNAAFSQLEGSIMKRNIGQIQRALELLEAEMAGGIYDIKVAFQAYNLFMYSFCLANAEKYDSFLLDYKQLAGTFADIHDMFHYLRGLLLEYSGVKAAPALPGAKSDTFNNIMTYINEHFCEEISIHTISTVYAVNPNYVSQLFKRQTGETFTEYITKLKVNFACNLLKTTDLSVADVADRVGFSDYYYFTRVFKKIAGETPTAFREKSAQVRPH